MNRTILLAITVLIIGIWFAAFANACTPGAYGGSFFGPSWGPPIFIGGGGWNRGGWDRGSGGSSSPSTRPSAPSTGRSIGGSIGGGGIKGGSGGK